MTANEWLAESHPEVPGDHWLGHRVGLGMQALKTGGSPVPDVHPPDSRLDSEAKRAYRRLALAALADAGETFVDPCDALAALARPNCGGGSMLHLLLGAAHGDLHGRNILTSIVRDTVGSTAVFDFGDMRTTNLVAWDFVKLEMELKVRAYPLVYEGDAAAFARRVHGFETRLSQAVRAEYDGLPKPADEAGKKLQRLRELLLEIRRLAGVHLGGPGRERKREWLEECNFLTACYGVYAGKFPTYGQQELIGAYVAAGVAAARLTWVRRRLRLAERLQAAEAGALLAKGDPTAAASADA
ncbi:MAG: phosphotransferase, partial [Planctomycetia bacterium]